MTFAGLWERNTHLGIESCTIVVTEPNAVLAPIHDRMPVILAPDDHDAWLMAPRKDLLRPAPPAGRKVPRRHGGFRFRRP